MIGQYKKIKLRTGEEFKVRIEDDNLVIPIITPIDEKNYDVTEILVNGDLIRQLVNKE